jgi:hypothetical protein
MGNITIPKLKSTTHTDVHSVEPPKLNSITLLDIRSVLPPKLNSKTNTEIETQLISNDKEIKTINLSVRYCNKIMGKSLRRET